MTGGVGSGVNIDRAGHRRLPHAEKKFAQKTVFVVKRRAGDAKEKKIRAVPG